MVQVPVTIVTKKKKKKITPKFHGLKEQQSFYNVIDMWVRNLERIWLSPSNLGSL